MKRKGHLRLLLTVTIAWIGFWLAGLPDYYQQYSTTTMIWFDGVLLVVLAGVAYLGLRKVRPQRRMVRALWIAFYCALPLAVYDLLYCGFYLGYGLSFLWRFWYVSVYYIIPWLLFPGVAALLPNKERTVPKPNA